MKIKQLALLLLLCQAAVAQTLQMNSLDKDTGIRTILTNNHRTGELTKEDTVARDGMVFFSAGYQKLKTGTEIYFVEMNIVHKDNRLGCLKNGESKVIFTFEDGSTIECIQISDTDCDAVGFTAAFALMPKKGNQENMKANFQKLLTTDAMKMELVSSERSSIYHIRSVSRPVIKSHFTLLDKTIKASL